LSDPRRDSAPPPTGAVLVAGGGIAGMQAALDLAESGFAVRLVERATAIGGRMAQLDKTFPTNDCSMCTLSPKLIEVDKHRDIELLVNAEITGCTGEAGRFAVEVLRHPTYVDPDKCNSCGDCLEVCPVSLPAEFDEGLGERRAIYKRYPQAIPAAVTISKEARPPCVLACPAGVNCQGYLALIGAGKIAEAFALIRERNPLPAVCGRICHHPCEAECHRRDLDEPVAINPLKRFAADWVAARRAAGEDPAPPPRGAIDPNKPRVAVVGGGPAGLTAARDLALLGYPVTLLEAEDQPGGTVLNAIPSYRLPAEILAQDLADIQAAGFEIQTNQRLGRDFTIDRLREQGFQAVFLAVGRPDPAQLLRDTAGQPLKGLDLQGVLLGLRFLRAVKRGENPRLHGKAVVIGGGNVAIDAAMTARRQGAERVEIVSLECRADMPAHETEIRDALEEGIALNPSWGLKRILGENGRVTGLRLARCTCVISDAGRFAPEFDDSCDTEIAADFVIVAIGQLADFSFLEPDDPLWDEFRRLIAVDEQTLQTNVEWIFAGGDVATGPKSVIAAVAQGRRAAEAIDRYLTGRDLRDGRRFDKPESAPRPTKAFAPQLVAKRSRAVPARRSPGERGDFDEIELTLSEAEALAEAKRCLNCGLCSECRLCVAACPAEAIRHDMQPERLTLPVGAILLAPGYAPFDPALRDEYGHGRYPNVVTGLEFERLLSASGPCQGHVRRPSDGRPPRRMAWIQCVGSRDARLGREFCSGICCMAAIKQAMMALDHVPGLETTIFHNDIRAYGKGFEAYYNRAERRGVRFRRGLIASVKERPRDRDLLLDFLDEAGRAVAETFDLVVLSVGLQPAPDAAALAAALRLELDEYGFCRTDPLNPVQTTRPGVFVAGVFGAPRDIPETIMTACAAAATAGEALGPARGSLTGRPTFPPERDTTGEEPRVGVFVCRCGTNIARSVDVPRAATYAATLPGVVYAEENVYTCSTDTQARIVAAIREHRLNRVVVASCSPRTHEPLFQETLREAGLNRRLFEMANIRDQCSWVHFDDPPAATAKALDLIRMAVGRAATLRPFPDIRLPVDRRAIVIGAGLAGLTAALCLAEQGFEVAVIEKEAEPGGLTRRLRHALEGPAPQTLLRDLLDRVRAQPLIQLHLGAEPQGFAGHLGAFEITVRQGNRRHAIHGGAIIVATGGAPYEPVEYGYPESEAVVTQLELEERMADPAFAAGLREAVMIQCVGSREPDHPACSRLCCQEAVKNALELKRANPAIRVYVLYRDMRTYGMTELAYRRAREAGVIFIRFDADAKPRVRLTDGLEVRVRDAALGRPVGLRPDLVVLAAAIRPHPSARSVAQLLKVPLDGDGFFLESHVKLKPLDFGADGIFLAGLAHAPKTMAESMAQARGAAGRAATILAKETIERSGVISEVDPTRCAACLTCVRLCPYDVPVVREDGAAYIDPAACHGCGVCASSCPRRAIATYHYRDEQLAAKIDALFAEPAPARAEEKRE